MIIKEIVQRRAGRVPRVPLLNPPMDCLMQNYHGVTLYLFALRNVLGDLHGNQFTKDNFHFLFFGHQFFNPASHI